MIEDMYILHCMPTTQHQIFTIYYATPTPRHTILRVKCFISFSWIDSSYFIFLMLLLNLGGITKYLFDGRSCYTLDNGIKKFAKMF